VTGQQDKTELVLTQALPQERVSEKKIYILKEKKEIFSQMDDLIELCKSKPGEFNYQLKNLLAIIASSKDKELQEDKEALERYYNIFLNLQ
jgi:hypothetical protein